MDAFSKEEYDRLNKELAKLLSVQSIMGDLQELMKQIAELNKQRDEIMGMHGVGHDERILDSWLKHSPTQMDQKKYWEQNAPIGILEAELYHAVAIEDYEKACILRDIINNRK